MKKVSEKILYQGNWLELKESSYDNNGIEVKWEMVDRKISKITVAIIAKLIPSERYVFIKQYRIPIRNYMIGFPAGVSDGKDLEHDIKKELKEETGYSGEIIKISPVLKSNPGLTDETVRIAIVEINENMFENINPRQELEPSEEIEVILLKKEEIRDFIKEQTKKGVDIGVGVWYTFNWII
ncbi:MAG: adenosine nucleotide hydrolase NudE [Candidatus Methanofastidiosum methylothiophilum]|uniref:Adenosine nucleotide hydrolase NudE n=1 Tax=Candidatus Methanofastidiosum methylothiophilum TaxID=1705564 RepID=A0A150J030_9EURY|nr:MAG: adenosine nucleotide hydrolase NudE [Candidatus Methanofastidiosum methylthiophilus]NMC75753.1 NUDIX hydrolase [Candidatus Methanofastidiosa archaeon]